MTHNTVSIIIPTYNRKKTLLETLNALFDQTYPEVFEIIVVDGGSTDGTIEMLSGMRDKGRNVNFYQKKGGPAVGRNMGIERAKGEIILFTDDDCVPEKDWVQKHVEWYRRDRTLAGVSGLLIPRYPTMLDTVDFYDHKTIYIEKQITYNYPVIGTNNCSYRRPVLMELKGFDESFEMKSGKVLGGEDSDLAVRAMKKGRIVIDPDIVVYHLKVNKFTKKKIDDWFRWGVGAYIFNSKQGTVHFYQFLVPLYTLARTALFLFKLKNAGDKAKLSLLYFTRQFIMDIGYLSKALNLAS